MQTNTAAADWVQQVGAASGQDDEPMQTQQPHIEEQQQQHNTNSVEVLKCCSTSR